MEKVNEIRNVLKFYVKVDELKTKMKDNQSMADHIFGSMILATAFDSEFKEAENLSKIYKMIFFTEFSNLDSDYDFKDLKLKNQYLEEVKEFKNIDSENGKLVSKYKMLDILLTNLIKGNSSLSKSDLIKEGSKIIALLFNKNISKCEEIFKFYYLNFRLKDKVRTGWDTNHWNIKSDRIERISEHVVGVFGLLLATSSEFEYDLDIDKASKMVVLHEIGETIIGDITPFDGVTPEKKKEIEHEAMKKALGNLKDKDIYLGTLYEFDEHETPEAKCTHYCDKIDADLKSKTYQDGGKHHSLDDQKNNVVFKSSKVKKMIENGAQDAFDIWYEWDKTIYEGDEQFPEFFNVLKIARDNNLLQLDTVIKEKIKLTSEEHSFLSKKLTNIIKKLYEDPNIDAVYSINYQDKENIKGTLDIVVVLENRMYYRDYSIIMEKLNSKMAKNNDTGIKVSFYRGISDGYSIVAMTSDEVRMVEQLEESTILFDKSGKLSRVKEVMKKYNHLYNFNLVDYVPPVDEVIISKLNKSKQSAKNKQLTKSK